MMYATASSVSVICYALYCKQTLPFNMQVACQGQSNLAVNIYIFFIGLMDHFIIYTRGLHCNNGLLPNNQHPLLILRTA